MSRLIDADNLNDAIEEFFKEVCGYDVSPNEAVMDFQSIVDEQPTAYDVDKIISYIDRLANNGTGKAKSLAYLKKFIENGCNVVELEEALKAINTIKEFCRQTSLGDCSENKCEIHTWCRGFSNRVPEEWEEGE